MAIENEELMYEYYPKHLQMEQEEWKKTNRKVDRRKAQKYTEKMNEGTK